MNFGNLPDFAPLALPPAPVLPVAAPHPVGDVAVVIVADGDDDAVPIAGADVVDACGGV